MSDLKIEQVCQRAGAKVRSILENAPKVKVGIIDDVEIATYASYQEYGWVQRVTPKQSHWFKSQGISHPPRAGSSLVLPPRPFFRATVAAHSKEWAKLMKQVLDKHGPDGVMLGLQLVGMKATEDLKQTLIDGGTDKEKFPERAPLTLRLYANQSKGHKQDGSGNASNPRPLIKTGAMLNALGFQIDGDT